MVRLSPFQTADALSVSRFRMCALISSGQVLTIGRSRREIAGAELEEVLRHGFHPQRALAPVWDHNERPEY